MRELKTGDWVKNKYLNTVYQVKDIFRDGYSQYATSLKLEPRNLWDSGLYGAPESIESLEHWQPQEGEYIFDKDFGLAIVISNTEENGIECRECFNSKQLFTTPLKDCEPFIGKLPSYIKDR